MEPSNASPNPSNLDSQAFKLAVAVALHRYQKKKEQPQPDAGLQLSNSKSEEVDRWKKKAKERKRELIRLRSELQQLEDGGGGKEDQREVCSRVVSCSCHFFDECGELWTKRIRLGAIANGDGCEDGTVHEHWIDDVLRRRFIRYVRSNERRKRSGGSVRRSQLIEINPEDELEQLSTSADFLVQLSDTLSMEKSTSSVAALSHLAVDFIIASVKNLLSLRKDDELVEEITNGLIMRLTNRMCSATKQDGSSFGDSDSQSCVQHLIRTLGTESYIGQHVMLLVSQRICVLAESLLMMDPFDDAFPDMHDWVFMMF